MAQKSRVRLHDFLDISAPTIECGTIDSLPAGANGSEIAAPSRNTMDAPIIHQNINIIGDGNNVNVSAGDMNVSPPAPSCHMALPTRPRTSHRWLGPYATGGLAFIASLVFAITQIPDPSWPEGKTALCKDGWYSASQHRSGTCSSHGGVAEWRFPADHPFWRR